MKTIALLLLCSLLPISEILAQEIINLSNPSLEDIPRAGKANGYSVRSWYDCNQEGQTFVDIQPGFFTVEKSASHGNTYLGMICREDGTWEGISQGLKTALLQDQLYAMSIDLARSPTYISQSKSTGQEENFANPVKLRIFGGDNYCSRIELLAETAAIDNEEWNTYAFKFIPKASYDFVLFEAYYISNTETAYNGNLLMDNFSAIYPVESESEVMKVLGVEINTNSENLSLGKPIKVNEPERIVTSRPELRTEQESTSTIKRKRDSKPIAEVYSPKKKKDVVFETKISIPVKKKPQRNKDHVRFTNKFLTDYELLQTVDLFEMPEVFFINVGNVYQYCIGTELRSFARYYRQTSPKKMRELAKSLVGLEAIDASIYMFELADAKEENTAESEESAERLLADNETLEKMAPDLLIQMLKEYVAKESI